MSYNLKSRASDIISEFARDINRVEITSFGNINAKKVGLSEAVSQVLSDLTDEVRLLEDKKVDIDRLKGDNVATGASIATWGLIGGIGGVGVIVASNTHAASVVTNHPVLAAIVVVSPLVTLLVNAFKNVSAINKSVKSSEADNATLDTAIGVLTGLKREIDEISLKADGFSLDSVVDLDGIINDLASVSMATHEESLDHALPVFEQEPLNELDAVTRNQLTR